MNDDLQQSDSNEEELAQEAVSPKETIATPEEEVAEAEVETETDKPEAQSSDDKSSVASAQEGALTEKEETAVVPTVEPIEKIEEAPSSTGQQKGDDNSQNVSPAGGGDTLDDADIEEPTAIADTAASLSQKWPGQWYVLHTYSGYEDAVAESLKQRINSLDMQDKIFDVLVPKENQIEIKNGKRKIVEKKMFPGYVLVNMNVTEDSWYVVRNTPNVTGFIGSGTVPVPVAEHELRGIFKRMDVEEPKYKIDVNIGDLVHIKDGPFKNYDGSVSEIDEEKGKIKVLVSIFGRETPVELDFLQIKKA